MSADALPDPDPGGEAYVDLARWLARAMPSRPGRAHELQEAGRRIGRDLAPDERAEPVGDLLVVLRRLGFAPSVTRRGRDRTVCRLGNCPYAESARANPQIVCTLHRGITGGLLDSIDPAARMTRFVARDPDEAGCEFEVRGLGPDLP